MLPKFSWYPFGITKKIEVINPKNVVIPLLHLPASFSKKNSASGPLFFSLQLHPPKTKQKFCDTYFTLSNPYGLRRLEPSTPVCLFFVLTAFSSSLKTKNNPGKFENICELSKIWTVADQNRCVKNSVIWFCPRACSSRKDQRFKLQISFNFNFQLA